KAIMKRPWAALVGCLLVVATSCVPLMKVPKTFLPTQDSGEFSVSLDMVPGTSLEKMRDRALEVDKILREDGEVVRSLLTVGTTQGEKNKSEFYAYLKPFGQRKMSTSDYKALMREKLKKFTDANPVVKDIDYVGGGQRPFQVNIVGQDLAQVTEFSNKLFAK